MTVIKQKQAQQPVYVRTGRLNVDNRIYSLVNDEIVPGTGIETAKFFECLEKIIVDLEPRNKQLLQKRDTLQAKIDSYHINHMGQAFDIELYKKFLQDIGYLVPEGPDFKVTTNNVDDEIASVAGPQLVVPVNNARYALNAANARWGSIFDALYGTNVIGNEGGAEPGTKFNSVRARKVFEWVDSFLDENTPLVNGSWTSATGFFVKSGVLGIILADGKSDTLKEPSQFVGYVEKPEGLSNFLLCHHGLHIEFRLDLTGKNPIASVHHAKVQDVMLESALSTIMDCEDSVTAVDAEDKTLVYHNWAGLMKGDICASFVKGGKKMIRNLHEDCVYTAPDGGKLVLPGRALLLVRNVGNHMYTDCILLDDKEVPETFIDAMVTALAAMHDLKKLGKYCNSKKRSVYIVKPKMHGPEEVALNCELFGRVEDALGLPRNTLKIGVMDEERRTTVNLKECIRAAKERIFFINTGFLDRTGDEIHTSMKAGTFSTKDGIKDLPWLQAYEDWNVDTGLETGFPGHAQIGKGMWAAPDCMLEMVKAKTAHPMAGANTAWVPSPTAATLHAIHYHRVDVHARQKVLSSRPKASLGAILTPPLAAKPLSVATIESDVKNDAQGILGYVVRWVEQGIGCSKVPNIHNVGLMEDRATLRISSQHLANWLTHQVLDKAKLRQVFEEMAAVVDSQNKGDADYRPMAPNFDNSLAFQAALELVLQGEVSPNGYTEPILTAKRREFKAKNPTA